MPVTLNEPLSALQRVCEELEYSELLDEAASLDNVYDRMVNLRGIMTSSWCNVHGMTTVGEGGSFCSVIVCSELPPCWS